MGDKKACRASVKCSRDEIRKLNREIGIELAMYPPRNTKKLQKLAKKLKKTVKIYRKHVSKGQF